MTICYVLAYRFGKKHEAELIAVDLNAWTVLLACYGLSWLISIAFSFCARLGNAEDSSSLLLASISLIMAVIYNIALWIRLFMVIIRLSERQGELSSFCVEMAGALGAADEIRINIDEECIVYKKVTNTKSD